MGHIVTLPHIQSIYHCLDNAYNNLNKLRIVFSKRHTKLNWKKCYDSMISEELEKVDEDDNVYFIFSDDDGELLYVGKATKSKSIRKRLREHLLCKSVTTNSKLGKIKTYIVDEKHKSLNIATIKIEPVECSVLAESYFIKKFKPIWNKRKD